MKKVFLSSLFLVALALGANAQRTHSDIMVPLIPIPRIENPDMALPDFDKEVEEPKEEATLPKADSVLTEDKDRKKKKAQN